MCTNLVLYSLFLFYWGIEIIYQRLPKGEDLFVLYLIIITVYNFFSNLRFVCLTKIIIIKTVTRVKVFLILKNYLCLCIAARKFAPGQ